MHMIDGTTCLMEVEQLIREYTQMLGRDLSFQKLEEELRDLMKGLYEETIQSLLQDLCERVKDEK